MSTETITEENTSTEPEVTTVEDTIKVGENTETLEAPAEDIDVSSLSTEEYNAMLNALETGTTEETEEETEEEAETETETEEETETAEEGTETETAEEEEETEEEETEEEETEEEETETVKKTAPVETEKVPTAEEKEVPVKSVEEVNEIIMKPYKHRGREIDIKTAEEIRTLVSKGLDYGRKSQELAKSRKTVQSLETNGIETDEELSLLLAAKNGDKGALLRIIEDNKIKQQDLYGEEFDEQFKRPTYEQKDNLVSQEQASLTDVINTLKGNEDFGFVMENINTEWDSGSKQTLAQHPKILNTLTEHKEQGIFEVVTSEIIKQEAINGKMNNNIDAYINTYTEMERNGAFSEKPAATEPTQAPKPMKAETKTEKKAKAAASSGKQSVAKTKKPIDVSAMTEKELNKFIEENKSQIYS